MTNKERSILRKIIREEVQSLQEADKVWVVRKDRKDSMPYQISRDAYRKNPRKYYMFAAGSNALVKARQNAKKGGTKQRSKDAYKNALAKMASDANNARKDKNK